MFYFKQQYDQAIEQSRKTLALDPDFINAHICLYLAYTMKGKYDEAIDEYFKLQRLTGTSQSFFRGHEAALRKAYAKSGIRGFWQTKITRLLDDPSPNRRDLAPYYALLGEKEAALAHLSRAYQGRAFGLASIKTDPIFSSLYGDPRFQQLAERICSVAGERTSR